MAVPCRPNLPQLPQTLSLLELAEFAAALLDVRLVLLGVFVLDTCDTARRNTLNTRLAVASEQSSSTH
eukprot:5410131-Prymnesium_polylepis.1